MVYGIECDVVNYIKKEYNVMLHMTVKCHVAHDSEMSCCT